MFKVAKIREFYQFYATRKRELTSREKNPEIVKEEKFGKWRRVKNWSMRNQIQEKKIREMTTGQNKLLFTSRRKLVKSKRVKKQLESYVKKTREINASQKI